LQGDDESSKYREWLAVISRFNESQVLGFMQMFGHYDCGGTHKNPDRRGRLPPTVSVAGYLATASQWYEHDRLWLKRLKADGFSEFHMTDFMACKESFQKCATWSDDRKNEFLSDLISITANNVTYGIGMAVHRADYNRVFSEEPIVVERALGSPYAFCAFRCFETGVDWSKKHRSIDPINYIFERGDQYWEQIDATHRFLCSSYWLGRRYWLGSLTFEPKRNTSLQAADLLTWELNREFYRQYYPEPEYAYSRNTLVALMERVDGLYKSYSEDDFRGYIQDLMRKDKKKFFIMNVPADIEEELTRRLDEKPVRVSKVRRNDARPISGASKRTTTKTRTRKASKAKKKRKA
jgi:hypothetical protein